MNWICKITACIIGTFLLAAFLGTNINQYRKISRLPVEVRYQIIVHENIWPDRFYSESYTLQDPNGFRLETYWTFEPGTHPFSVAKWIYHPVPLVMIQVDSTINELWR